MPLFPSNKVAPAPLSPIETAKNELTQALKTYEQSKKSEDDKLQLNEVVVKYSRLDGILGLEEWNRARKLSDTYVKGGRHKTRGRKTRRRRHRRRTSRR